MIMGSWLEWQFLPCH